MGESLTRADYIALVDKIDKLRKAGHNFYDIANELNITLYRIESVASIYQYNISSLLRNDLYKIIHICTMDDKLSFGTQICKTLERNNITTVEDFKRCTDNDLIALHGIGPKYLEALTRVRNYINNSATL